MAAGMQHDDGARWQLIEVLQQAGAVDAVAGGIVVAVALYREAGRFEQRAVVFPARVADRDNGIGQQTLEEVGADL